MSRIGTAVRILQNEGAKPLASATISFLMRSVSDKLISTGVWLKLSNHRSYNEVNRTDSTQRWTMMESYMKSDGGSCLDIGCADGFFTAKAAQSGYYTIGIDSSSSRLENARRTYRNEKKSAFIQESITPENIAYLPNTDIVFLLTVFHHWCGAFGNDSAKEMMRILATNSQKIVFEPPGIEAGNFSKISDERSVSESESSKEYYEDLLEEIFSGRVGVEYMGKTEYNPTTDRTDPMFLINCSDYSQ